MSGYSTITIDFENDKPRSPCYSCEYIYNDKESGECKKCTKPAKYDEYIQKRYVGTVPRYNFSNAQVSYSESRQIPKNDKINNWNESAKKIGFKDYKSAIRELIKIKSKREVSRLLDMTYETLTHTIYRDDTIVNITLPKKAFVSDSALERSGYDTWKDALTSLREAGKTWEAISCELKISKSMLINIWKRECV